MTCSNSKSPATQDASTTLTPVSAKTASTQRQTAQREINYAIFRLKGMQIILPKDASALALLDLQTFLDARDRLIETLKTEHLRRTK